MRDLIVEKSRGAEIVRERVRAEQLAADLPAIIESQVGSQMQKLEDKLVSEFKELGQRAVEQSTNALTEQLNTRLETLEKVSAVQSSTLKSLHDSSKMAYDKVEQVVGSIETTLAGAVPGFQLEPRSKPSASPTYVHPQFQLEAPKKTAGKDDADEAGDMEADLGKVRFCPACTSTNIRRTNRKGVFEEFLRLFFIAPFRCRACRHKFYKF
jgi:hypothetical protein